MYPYPRRVWETSIPQAVDPELDRLATVLRREGKTERDIQTIIASQALVKQHAYNEVPESLRATRQLAVNNMSGNNAQAGFGIPNRYTLRTAEKILRYALKSVVAIVEYPWQLPQGYLPYDPNYCSSTDDARGPESSAQFRLSFDGGATWTLVRTDTYDGSGTVFINNLNTFATWFTNWLTPYSLACFAYQGYVVFQNDNTNDAILDFDVPYGEPFKRVFNRTRLTVPNVRSPNKNYYLQCGALWPLCYQLISNPGTGGLAPEPRAIETGRDSGIVLAVLPSNLVPTGSSVGTGDNAFPITLKHEVSTPLWIDVSDRPCNEVSFMLTDDFGAYIKPNNMLIILDVETQKPV